MLDGCSESVFACKETQASEIKPLQNLLSDDVKACGLFGLSSGLMRNPTGKRDPSDRKAQFLANVTVAIDPIVGFGGPLLWS